MNTTTTLKDAANDTSFINALIALPEFWSDIYKKTEVNSALASKVDVNGTNATEAGVNTMLGKLKGDNVVAKVSDLGTPAVAGKVFDATFAVSDATNPNKKVAEVKLGNTFVKTDGSNIETQADKGKALVEKIFDTTGGEAYPIFEKKLLAERTVKNIFTAIEDEDIGKSSENQKSILVQELGTLLGNTSNVVYGNSNNKQTAKDFLAEKASLVKTDGSNIATLLNAEKTVNSEQVKIVETELAKTFVKAADLETPAVAGKVLNAKDGQKSILAEKLGGFLDTTNTEYSGKIAKAFLGEKGMKPTPQEVATQLLTDDNKGELAREIAQNSGLRAAVTSDSGLRSAVIDNLKSNTDFKTAVTIQVNSKDPAFQGSVREVMSQPSFEIPTSNDAPLSWDWI